MTKGITWEEAGQMFEKLTETVKEQGLVDITLQKVMVCDKCNYQFLLTEAQIKVAKNLCPMCGNSNGIFPLWINKEQVTA